MLSNPLIATTLIFALIALGEWLSIISKARIPMLLTAMVGYLICIWTGIFPKDILATSQFAALGAMLVGPAILHMGTMIPFSLLKTQYKAVLISLGGIIVSGVLILVIVSFLFDYPTAVAGIGPLSGGVVALIITSEKLTEIGLTSLVVIPALIVAFQGLLGMPLAQYFLRKYAFTIQEQIDNGTFKPMEDTKLTATKETAAKSPIKSSMTLKLFFVFVGAAIGTALGEVTPIHYSLWCLAFGVTGLKLGIFEHKSLEKANSFNLTMIAIIFVVIGTMADVSPQDVLNNLPSIIVLLLLGTLGISLGGFIVSKLLKWHPYKGMPVALTALFGFPADYILCEEVSRSIARNKEEEETIFNEMLTPMLIGGFTTVTIASVVIAGILVQTL
ncbi:hypothetical protein [Oceanobacillus profundus]|uniref:Uncharacterized protein n=1 Tax=Oceanobacillus profundus TaxID=372463 RepID=A0A417YDJ8_9BACI|nr:hypothetical protein [Oceanobacillus profundus]MBR3117919.1 hypothetical protein [Oceanobacillus sp.]PAE28893.1 hypothetical protein CHI07_11445 [Paenibacillus sp. 7884-2]MCM3397344.1 hypothetical protein [Oceanobacillus profundus]MDO6451529.1 hypothetical protein [Oceanobacillus profundus]RHW30689.1 hypothetical protein D1B32_16385 [Oceanobacillus profundus]